jgi:Zn-finger nucleic acid-binding protein
MISIMDCRNCGAPMELFERRRYYFCSYCGTFHFIETPAVDGVQVLDRPVGARPCPLCSAPLAKSLLDETHVIEYCEQCRGVLIPRSEFADAVSRRRARESGPPAPPAVVDQRELKRQVICPSCRAKMDVHPYYGPGNVIIDTCSRCNLIWLDFGELKQITEAPGRDRGRRPGDVFELFGQSDDAAEG